MFQRDKPISIWGCATAGEKLTIQFNKQTKSTTTDSKGKWQVMLSPEDAGGPFQLTVKGNNQVNIQNILVGEVWVCSGQSNMEMPIEGWGQINSYKQEIAAANYPQIRHFKVPNTVSATLKEDITGGDWKVCSPQTVDTFSAVAYYFALQIHKATGYPVGIINSTWGGTAAESWTKREVLEKDPDFKILIDKYDEQVQNYPTALEQYKAVSDKWKQDTTKPKPVAPVKPNPDKSPFRLYNAMIAPLIPYTLKGVIWYQGENNAQRAYQYRTLFPAMIANWRSDFKNSKLPFYFVQISPHRSQNPEIREAQLLTYRSIPNTGIVVTTDNGDSLDIHPRNKKLVGERLSLWALQNQYGKKDVVVSGPLYKAMNVNGNRIEIDFDFVDGGLVANDGKELTEFTIAGDDQQFVPAKAVIEGPKVVVWNDAVVKPTAVRFAWKNVPQPNLFNKAGLPASPFRTDNWKGVTEGKNF